MTERAAAEAGVDDERVAELRPNASAMTAPEVAELACGLAGPPGDVGGGPPGDSEPDSNDSNPEGPSDDQGVSGGDGGGDTNGSGDGVGTGNGDPNVDTG